MRDDDSRTTPSPTRGWVGSTCRLPVALGQCFARSRVVLLLTLVSLCGSNELRAQVDGASVNTLRGQIERIEDAYRVKVAFATSLLPDTTVRFALDGTGAREELGRLLRPHRLTVEEVGTQFVVVPYVERLRSLTGFVIDGTSEERLVGATVYAILAQRGVTTNGYGYFSVTELQPEERVVVRYVGYNSDTFALRKVLRQPAVLSLTPNLELQAVEVRAKSTQPLRLPAIGRALPPSQLTASQFLRGREDVNSWLSLQPGVASAAGGYRGYGIRGADPEHNLTLLDDATLYLPSHGVGYFSIVPGEAIRSWRLEADAGPASYGDRVGGVLDLRLREGSRQRLGGELNVGISDVGLTYEGPLGKGSFFTSARRGLTDFWLSALRPAIRVNERPDLDFTFYDLALKVNHPLGRRQQLLGSVFVGRDDYSDEAQVAAADQTSDYSYRDRSDRAWNNLLGSLRYTALVKERWFVNTTLTFSDFRYLADDLYELTTRPFATPDSVTVARASNVFDSRIRDVGLKADIQYALSTRAVAHLGVDAVAHTFSIRNWATQSASSDPLPTTVPTLPLEHTVDLSHYLSLDLDPLPALSLQLGVRVATQLSSERGYTGILPRLHGSYVLHPRLRVDAGLTRARQYIHQIGTNNPGLPRDLWVPTIRGLRPLESDQANLSATGTATANTTLTIGAYVTRLRGLARLSNDFVGSAYTDWVENLRLGIGAAEGVYVSGATELPQWTFDYSYTLQRNWRRFDDGFGELGPVERSRLDRRHFAALTAIYRPRSRWAISSTARVGSGLPARVPQRATVIGPAPETSLPETNLPLTNPWNYEGRQQALPNYLSVDLGARYTWGTSELPRKLTFGVQNVTLRRNPLFINLRRVNRPAPGEGLYENTFVYAPPLLPFLRYAQTF